MEHRERKQYELTIALLSLVTILSISSNVVDGWRPHEEPVSMLYMLPTWPMAMLVAWAILGEVALLALAHRVPKPGWRVAAYAWGVLALACTGVVAMMWLLS